MLATQRTVLHVDDDPLITAVVAERLGRAGFACEQVNDPREAIVTMERGQHCVVVLDVHMPHRSGLQLLSDIKRRDGGVQVILLTGLVNESTVLDAIHLGAEACFFKPFRDPEPFLRCVEDAFAKADRWWHTLRELTARRRADGVVARG